MRLNELTDRPGAKRARKRVGRGTGSGTGTTAGRGSKGQKSRSGVSLNGFEGGQMPLHRRLPKRGFNNMFAKDFNEVNIGRIQQAVDAKKLDAKKTVTVETLISAGVVRRRRDGVRLLGKGELSAKLSFEVNGVSKGAAQAVEKAGGTVTVIDAGPAAREEKPVKAESKPADKPAQDIKADKQPAKTQAKTAKAAEPAKDNPAAKKSDKPAKPKAKKD
jgi:large subunit ribosomal protein L15